jgi:peptidyl-prolyl cis-trans isomerase A (cyclophilin A)
MLFITSKLFYPSLSFYLLAGITLILTKYRSTFAALGLSFLIPLSAHATVVEVRTVLGDIQVNLFDETTPATVANFLSYVNSAAYVNNIVHRVEPGFVVQAGGFQYNGQLPLDEVPAGPPVINEPELSNLRGTVAMAKIGGNPNSATSQWFFNLANNSANLDVQNSGFTVFGQVIEGMDVVDAIAAVNLSNQGGVFTSIPLRNYNGTDTIDDQHLVLITDIVVVDSATLTNTDLNPAANTLINPPVFVGGDPDSGSGGGGGGMSWLLAFVGFGLLRKKWVF